MEHGLNTKLWKILAIVLAMACIFPAALAEEGELSVDYAEHFKIEYLEDSVKVVTDSNDRQMILVPEGQEVPAGYEDLPVVTTPLKNALYDSTIEVGMLQAFADDSVYDSIGAVTTSVEYWTIQEIIDRLNSGEIDFLSATHESGISAEVIQEMNPDMVFSSGTLQSTVDLRVQMDELGIPYFVDGSSDFESGEEAFLEWVKLYAAFYNKDAEAEKFFEDSLANILSLSEVVLKTESRPTVAEGSIFDGVVYCSGGDSATAQKVEQAGGEYVFKDIPGATYTPISMETFVELAGNADILIFTSTPQYGANREALVALEPLLADFKAFRENTAYVYDPNFWMSSSSLYAKFEDIVHMIHPEVNPEHEFQHYLLMPDK